MANKKLTVYGGGQLLQAEAVLALIKGLPDFSIALFTGAEYEEVPGEILQFREGGLR